MAGAQGLRSIVLDHFRAQGIFAQHLLVCPSVHRAPSRVARVLLQTADRSDGPFVLSQDVLAEVLTLQRTTVSQCMATLRRTGLVDYARGEVSPTNRVELEKQACSCYSAFRELYKLRSGGHKR
ncbi:helix-turn-helix domain-containing protein [Caulobacter segnis]